MSTALPLLLEPLLPELRAAAAVTAAAAGDDPDDRTYEHATSHSFTKSSHTPPLDVLPGPQWPTKSGSVVAGPDRSKPPGCSSPRPNRTATRRRSAVDLLPEPQSAADDAINAVAPEGCVAVGLDAVGAQHAPAPPSREDRRTYLRALCGLACRRPWPARSRSASGSSPRIRRSRRARDRRNAAGSGRRTPARRAETRPEPSAATVISTRESSERGIPPCSGSANVLSARPPVPNSLAFGIASATCLVRSTALSSVIAQISTQSAPVLATAAASER